MFRRLRANIGAIFLSAAVAIMASSAVLVAQGAIIAAQNGTPTAPSIRGQTTGFGLWFPTGGVGLVGKIRTAGGLPVLSACGTGTLQAGSNDSAGFVTMTGTTGCTMTFSATWTTAPFCTVTPSVTTASQTVAVSATALTVAAGASGSSFFYHCHGPSA